MNKKKQNDISMPNRPMHNSMYKALCISSMYKAFLQVTKSQFIVS